MNRTHCGLHLYGNVLSATREANIRSRPRYRKGTWKRLGIQFLIVSIRRP